MAILTENNSEIYLLASNTHLFRDIHNGADFKQFILYSTSCSSCYIIHTTYYQMFPFYANTITIVEWEYIQTNDIIVFITGELKRKTPLRKRLVT